MASSYADTRGVPHTVVTADVDTRGAPFSAVTADASLGATRSDTNALDASLAALSVGRSALPTAGGRKLLILDINGLLLERIFPKDLSSAPSRKADCMTNGRLIFLRPHCRSFLGWCLEHFAVVVWSTAMRKNVLPLVSCLFPSATPQPAAALHQDDCTPTGLFDFKNKSKELRLKVLARLWARPELGAGFGPHNTLLLDDSPYKTIANPPHTAVHPAEWQAANATPELDEGSSARRGVVY